MLDVFYYWSKIFKKIRLSAIKNSTIHETSKVESGSNLVNVTMGRYSFCGYDCEISNCSIGSFCSIANGVVIGGGMHPYDWVSTSPVFYAGRDSVKAKFSIFKREEPLYTVIGHDVWIGQNCLIKQGVKIGNGAVIGMGSVVTRDVEPYSIVGGVPTKFIKKRLESNIVHELEAIEWWEFDEKKLKFYARFIRNPKLFIENIKKDLYKRDNESE